MSAARVLILVLVFLLSVEAVIVVDGGLGRIVLGQVEDMPIKYFDCRIFNLPPGIAGTLRSDRSCCSQPGIEIQIMSWTPLIFP